MKVRLLAFTEQGYELALDLAAYLGGDAVRCGESVTLAGWTADAFAAADALIYIGAAGIAVRAVAPLLQSKTEDPAVVVVDETGKYAIPILSGHLGRANAMARRVAAHCGGQAVITTATDLHRVFAVDLWAIAQNCAIREPERIKTVSSRLLEGENVQFESDWPVSGEIPDGLTQGGIGGFSVSVYRKDDDRLHLIPRIAVLGIGCRKGIAQQAIEEAFSALLDQSQLCREAICKVCTIDRKAEEPGLTAFCAAHGWPLHAFPSDALAALPGVFTASAFVAGITGVDNVCERAAVLGGGRLLIPKQASGGVTLAVALAPYRPDWRWEDV